MEARGRLCRSGRGEHSGRLGTKFTEAFDAKEHVPAESLDVPDWAESLEQRDYGLYMLGGYYLRTV